MDIVDNALILTDPTQTTYTNSTSTYTGYKAIRQACEDSLNNTAGPFAGAGLGKQRLLGRLGELREDRQRADHRHRVALQQ